MLPEISHPTDRPNFAIVSTEGIAYAFSYRTCIGFDAGHGWVLRKNDWSATTGKHLNYLNADHSRRLDADNFHAVLRAAQSDARVGV